MTVLKHENVNVAERLNQLGHRLPIIPENIHSYTPVIQSGNQVYVSGQIPKLDGVVQYQGRVGDSVSIEQAQEAARLAMLNLLAQVDAAIGLDQVKQFLKLQVYVMSADGFEDHPLVANAASNLLRDVFGEAGKHARTAFGCYSLPQSASVEIDAVFERWESSQ